MRPRKSSSHLSVFAILGFLTAIGVAAERTPISADSEQFITVTGAVRAPGKIPWTPGMTLTAAIIRTHGFGVKPPGYVFLIRGTERLRVDLRDIKKGRAPNLPLQPKDTVEAH